MKRLVILLLFLSQTAWAQTVNFKDYKLKNGLRVLLSEDHSAPTYSVAVTYNAGSRDERRGQTGYAHLFEHMMFQGSKSVGKGEHMIVIESNGGLVNGNTTPDRTMYFETLPANQLDLGLFLEADRMRSLAINQQNLDNQRETVKEERRERYDNEPYGTTYETMLDTAYDNFAYKHSTIGSMADLDKATVKDVADFFRIYYAPNNAVLAMVGDFKTEEALEKIRKYFEDIPRQPSPPAPNMTEPKQTSERRKKKEDALADLVQVDIVFKTPPGNTPDWYALSVAGVILADGQSSRLYQKLVKEKEIVQSVSAGPEDRRGPSMFTITLMLRPGKDPAEVEKLVYEELDRLKREPVSDAEMEKMRMQVRRSNVEQLKSTQGRAEQLGEAAVFYNDPNLVNTWPARYNAVTKQRIQEVARTYFIPSNRTVVTTVPKPQAATAGKEK
jgi:zinc protease